MAYNHYVPGGGEPVYQAHHHQPAQGHMYDRNNVTQYELPQSMDMGMGMAHQKGRNVQPSPPHNSTSPDVYRTQPHAYQHLPTPQRHWQSPYQVTPVQQQFSYQRTPSQQYYTPPALQQPPPRQYHHPQAPHQVPSQGYYQPSHDPVQPAYYQSLAKGSVYSQNLYQQPQNLPAAVHQQLRPSTSSQLSPQISAQKQRQPFVAAVTPQAAPTPQQRSVAHVQIPVERPAVASKAPDMPRAAKRRRSNDGEIVPAHSPPRPQKSSSAQRTKVDSGPDVIKVPSARAPPTPPSHVDYQATLLSLADEYVGAAYQMSSSLASSDFDSQEVEQYHQLISTALGCLESVLKNYRQTDARTEARIRLQLATLLHQETENSEQAEEILTKGIALCERNRLTDLKYAMHHLLVRVLNKGSSKAATKAVEKLIAEVEALKLKHWVYTFRFLRVSLGLQADEPAESGAILKHLATISATAEGQHDVAMQIAAATLEAMTHLRSGTTEAAELAQRSLATVRMHQLSPEMRQLPQLRALLDCLDLACALMQYNADRILEMVQRMHANIDSTKYNESWPDNSSNFLVSVGALTSVDVRADTAGTFAKTADGKLGLSFNWMHKGQLYALGYLLTCVASAYKRKAEAKVEEMFDAAMKLIDLDAGTLTRTLAAVVNYADWQGTSRITTRLQDIAAQCARLEWKSASRNVEEVDQAVTKQEIVLDTFTSALLVYLRAVCNQGSGHLEAAEVLYGSPLLAWDDKGKETSAVRDMQAVACMNRVQILRHLGQQDRADELLAPIEPFCIAHANKLVVAAICIVKAAAQGPNSPIVKLKRELSFATQAAKSTKNNQTLCIIMAMMTSMFFTNIVGDQAVKAARSSRTLARNAGSQLWEAVVDKMYGDTLELCGASQEAAVARRQAESIMGTLPESLKKRFAKEA